MVQNLKKKASIGSKIYNWPFFFKENFLKMGTWFGFLNLKIKIKLRQFKYHISKYGTKGGNRFLRIGWKTKEKFPCYVVAHIKLCSGCEIFFYKFAVIVNWGLYMTLT